MPKIWIDLANPSHPHFFNAILPDLKKKNQIQITARERGETVKLANQLIAIKGIKHGKLVMSTAN